MKRLLQISARPTTKNVNEVKILTIEEMMTLRGGSKDGGADPKGIQ